MNTNDMNTNDMNTNDMADDSKESQALEAKLMSLADDAAGMRFDASPDRRRIRLIVERGLPSRTRLIDLLADVTGTLSWRNVLFGLWDCMLLAAMVSLVAWGGVFGLASGGFSPIVDAEVDWRSRMLYVPTFIISPLMYGLVNLLTVWKEREARMDQLLRTYRWPSRRLRAMRMMAFSLISAAGTVLFAATVSLQSPLRVSFPTLLGVSFSSLFLFATGQLLADLRLPSPLSLMPMPALWAASSIAMALFRVSAEPLLARLPATLTLCVSALFAMIYLSMLRRYCDERPMELAPRVALATVQSRPASV
ncbi:hypothetical protein Uis1B_1809 [Bifidobacterium margollesii]|uniref:Uncharacterized protein n=1 Tax=Bifidobacterium margollesii TaxID=2020964 RepID=A0A2N5J7Y1_9BIFI|nr:hypothetical protein [Bifidobacterium margollesii]PLS30322.1 hypothetical protein Uis1B_1809 [Bifidobacterium margollesii]